jgi:hypothetical protein
VGLDNERQAYGKHSHKGRWLAQEKEKEKGVGEKASESKKPSTGSWGF